MDLAPEVARSFGVRRQPSRALLMLNAQRLDAGGPVSVPAAGAGHARNLVGQTERLLLRPVREGEWHYLLAEFQILNQEFIGFDVSVTPAGAPAPLAIRFQQQFFTD